MKQYTSIDAMRKAKLSMPYLSIENVKELIEQAYNLGLAGGLKGVGFVGEADPETPSEVMKLPTRQTRRKK